MRPIVLILVALPLLCWGQGNLVPNGGFEEKLNCPENPPDFHLCQQWVNPNAASPDYYHECSPSLMFVFGPDTVYIPNAGIPANAFGYQHAHTGEAYVGVYCLSVTQPDAGEYIQVQLTDSIVPSIRYEVSFYASLADNGRYAINSLGAYVSKEAIHRDDVQIFEVVPQILNTPENPLTDPDAWVLITDTFSSRYGGERYITIGNFNTTATSDTVLYNPDGDISALYAYYYIDDVSVIAIDSIPSSIGEVEEKGRIFKVYPNPSNGHFTVNYHINEMETGTIEVFDLVGKQVFTQPLSQGVETFDLQLNHLSGGTYFFRLQTNGQLRYSDKINIIKL